MAAFPCVAVFFNVAAVLYFNGSEVDARLFLLNWVLNGFDEVIEQIWLQMGVLVAYDLPNLYGFEFVTVIEAVLDGGGDVRAYLINGWGLLVGLGVVALGCGESAIFDFAVPLHIFFVRMHSQTVKGFAKFLPVLALNLAIVLLTRALDGVCSYLHLFIVLHHFLHPEVHIFLLHLQFLQPQPQQINHFVLVNQRSKQTESLLPKHHQLSLH